MTAVTFDSLLSRGRASARRKDIRPAIAWAFAILLFAVYANFQPDVVSRLQLTDLCSATAFLAALGLGEGLVILTRGIDLSLGGVLSMGTAIAATHFVSPGSEVVWSAVIIASGAAVGVLNGALIGIFELQPFIVTLATWSIVSGIALLILPVQGGSIPEGFANWINTSSAGFPNAAWTIVAMIVVWSWLSANACAGASTRSDLTRRGQSPPVSTPARPSWPSTAWRGSAPRSARSSTPCSPRPGTRRSATGRSSPL